MTHPWQRFADGEYRPQAARDAGVWERAAAVICVIFLAELLTLTYSATYIVSRREALSQYVYWRCRESLSTSVENLLQEREIRRWLADDGVMRRNAPRTRSGKLSSVMSFRGSFPELWPVDRFLPMPTHPQRATPPVEDHVFDLAYANTVSFRRAATRADLRAMMLLARGAGADPGALRFVRGIDVHRVSSAGLWVDLPESTVEPSLEMPRRPVPVVARCAKDLEDLAEARGEKFLLQNISRPPLESRPSYLCHELNRKMIALGMHVQPISVSSMRRAWVAEQLQANAPISSLMHAMRVTTLLTVEQLIPEFAPALPSNPAHLAAELGGLDHAATRARRREQLAAETAIEGGR